MLSTGSPYYHGFYSNHPKSFGQLALACKDLNPLNSSMAAHSSETIIYRHHIVFSGKIKRFLDVRVGIREKFA